MNNVLKGLLVLCLHALVIYFTPTPPMIGGTNTPSWLYATVCILIAALYAYFGYGSFKKDNRRLAGKFLFMLSAVTLLVTIFTLVTLKNI